MEPPDQPLGFTPAALADLDGVYDYHSADNADRLLDQIEEACTALRRYPEMGRARPELNASLRSLVAGPYTVFYRLRPDRIEVVRVLAQARDITPESFK